MQIGLILFAILVYAYPETLVIPFLLMGMFWKFINKK